MKSYAASFSRGLLPLLLFCMIHSPTFACHAEPANQKIFHLTNGKNSAEIPFQLVNDLIVIPVMLDGKRKLNFILDTGAASPVIFNRKYITGLNLPLGRSVTFYGAGKGQAVTGQVIDNVALHMSGVATDRIGMVVLDGNPFMNLKFDNIPIHGVIGATLFKCFVVEIDFYQHLLRLYEEDTFAASQDYEVLALNVRYEKPLIQASLHIGGNRSDIWLMVDTGFNNNLLLYHHENSPFSVPYKVKNRRVGVGYSGVVGSKTGYIDQLSIGKQILHEVFTIFPKTSSYQLMTTGEFSSRQGTLGVGALKNFNVIFDYTGHKFYIKGNSEEQPENLIAALKAKGKR